MKVIQPCWSAGTYSWGVLLHDGWIQQHWVWPSTTWMAGKETPPRWKRPPEFSQLFHPPPAVCLPVALNHFPRLSFSSILPSAQNRSPNISLSFHVLAAVSSERNGKKGWQQPTETLSSVRLELILSTKRKLCCQWMCCIISFLAHIRSLITIISSRCYKIFFNIIK